VFEFLRSRKYRKETLPAIRGEDHAIEVAFKDYPVRVSDDQQRKRIEYYPDFNTRLLHAIWDVIGDYDRFAEKALIEPVSLTVTVKNAPTFLCEIRLKTAKSKRLFTGEFPDAIIAAFKSNNIGR
jgi:hypothetical protein